MTLHPLFLVAVWMTIFQPQQQTVESNPLRRFHGTWKMVPGSLKSEPVPDGIDPKSITLEVVCREGADGLSMICEYKGNKTFITDQGRIPFLSDGSEMLVYEPNSKIIYKLGVTKNHSKVVEMTGTFVHIGKGTFENENKLLLTEYIAGGQTPAGQHIYIWESETIIREYSVYFGEDGEKISESSWTLEKTDN
ncbi:MAG: hypothetical protein R3D00_03960 [Bacteroidia bacterium]